MFWNKLFDKIYVLSLKDCNDRREHIRKEFAKVGLQDYEFFDASHFSSDEVKEFKKSERVIQSSSCFRCLKKRCGCENNFLTDFQIANWHSFVRIWQDIVDKKYKFVLICEDDIVFMPHFKRTILGALSKQQTKANNIKWNLPLLIGLGGAYHPQKHLLQTAPHLRRQNVMCNPCFCMNNQMAELFLKIYHVHHTSDHFMHIEVPQRIPIVQHFMMYPWPVYELSFVPSVSKFDSLVRPKGAIRRKEYKEFLFLSPSYSMNMMLLNVLKMTGIPMKEDNTPKGLGYRNNYGYITNYIWKNEEIKNRSRIDKKYLFTGGKEFDLLSLKTDLMIYNKLKENLEKINNNINNINNIIENPIDFYNNIFKSLGINNEFNYDNESELEELYLKFVKYIHENIDNVEIININNLPQDFYKKIMSINNINYLSVNKITTEKIKKVFDDYNYQISKLKINSENIDEKVIKNENIIEEVNEKEIIIEVVN